LENSFATGHSKQRWCWSHVPEHVRKVIYNGIIEPQIYTSSIKNLCGYGSKKITPDLTRQTAEIAFLMSLVYYKSEDGCEREMYIHYAKTCRDRYARYGNMLRHTYQQQTSSNYERATLLNEVRLSLQLCTYTGTIISTTVKEMAAFRT
jgi:hypothetical protein